MNYYNFWSLVIVGLEYFALEVNERKNKNNVLLATIMVGIIFFIALIAILGLLF